MLSTTTPPPWHNARMPASNFGICPLDRNHQPSRPVPILPFHPSTSQLSPALRLDWTVGITVCRGHGRLPSKPLSFWNPTSTLDCVRALPIAVDDMAPQPILRR